MAQKTAILSLDGSELKSPLPTAKSVQPFGSKILVEILTAKEIMNTALEIGDNVQSDGAPQAYIKILGPSVPKDIGLKEGQRIYWSGKGVQVDNPQCTNGRVNALLEISNILAIIEE